MPLVKAQCENCTGILTVDSSKKAAICPYCGTPYVVQDAINHYSTHIDNLHADVVNIQNGESKQNLLKNADTYYRLGQFDRAKKAYEKVIEKYPDEPQGWWGAYKAVFSNFSNFHELEEAYKQYASIALKLRDYKGEFCELWDALAKQYSTKLHISSEAKSVWRELSEKDVELMLYTSIGETSNPYLTEMRSAIFKHYYEAFTEGTITFFQTFDARPYSGDRFWQGCESYCAAWGETCKLSEIPQLKRVIDEGYQNGSELFPDGQERPIRFLKDHVQYISKGGLDYGDVFENGNVIYPWGGCIGYTEKSEMEEYVKCFHWDRPYKILFLLGRTIIVRNNSHSSSPKFTILLTKECLSSYDIKKMEIEQWKKEGLCAHCGGAFSRGFFSIKCDRCGRKKDY